MPQFKRGEQRHQVLIKKLRSDFTGFSLLPKIIQFKRLAVIEILDLTLYLFVYYYYFIPAILTINLFVKVDISTDFK